MYEKSRLASRSTNVNRDNDGERTTFGGDWRDRDYSYRVTAIRLDRATLSPDNARGYPISNIDET